MTDWSSRTCVVTGAATGVGRALALEAARRGAQVFVADLDDPAETVGLITAAGGRARGLVCDVRDDMSMSALASEICGDSGEINLVCANAGVGAGGDIDSVSSDDFRTILDVNVLGALRTVQAFVPALRRASGDGRPASVLVTGSEHSLGVPPHVPPMLAYTTSKHALLGLAACLRRDFSEDGIGVSILCPSYVRTERLRAYASASAEVEAKLEAFGQDGNDVACRALDGVSDGQFVIPTNPVSRDFVVETHGEIIDAMERVEQR